ncbi:hypothetical protein [Lacrimispora indolis]|uniref:hypothetical protein n=1 Tax=Lacrimispora indolis TaxID=69825 RepID=UPI00045E8B89|nr:hypothetical protein [Lacrimispora indolis]
MSEMILREMAEGLAQVNDLSWGMYAFSRDILRDKISEAEKKRMIELAICCGYEMADKVMSSLGTWDPWELAEKFKLKVEYADRGQIADRVLFALFTPPDQIQIMKEPIELAAESGLPEGLLTMDQIKSLILGHEIFHYLEEEEEGIYTRREKVVLWRLLGYKSESTVRALSEIAGMYFSKKINGFLYSPFALDILLYYNYNSNEALKMYREVLSY